MKRLIYFAPIVGFILFLISGYASADHRRKPAMKFTHTGEIRGVIGFCGESDVSGTIIYIPGKSIVAKLGPSGRYELLYVPPATYNLAVEIPGQPLHIIENVVVKKESITDLGFSNYCPDKDNDSYDLSVDCNDNNPAINPSAAELCDGVDNNCDGLVDEGCVTCTDDDLDGFFAQSGCMSEIDCDDTRANVYPGAEENCNDTLDNNCDGLVNEGCGGPGQQTFTSSGTFIVPTGVTQITVELWGAGGGGGGGAQKASIFCLGTQGGGGGGSGGYISSLLTVSPGESYSVNVGQGGIGGSVNNYGTPGQDSSFGSISARGGGGGGGRAGNDCAASAPNGEGGAGGYGSTVGNPGQSGDQCTPPNTAQGGPGGFPVLGGGGEGGSGGNGDCFGSPTAGDQGSNGLVRISWSY